MKQHITTEQLSELSEKGKEKLYEWWHPRELEYQGDPLLSIGQMIEFLDENQYTFNIFRRHLGWAVVANGLQYGKQLGGELCDALWRAVREMLNESSRS